MCFLLYIENILIWRCAGQSGQWHTETKLHKGCYFFYWWQFFKNYFNIFVCISGAITFISSMLFCMQPSCHHNLQHLWTINHNEMEIIVSILMCFLAIFSHVYIICGKSHSLFTHLNVSLFLGILIHVQILFRLYTKF